MKLTADNYHSRQANIEYMSVSQYKSFLQCEAATMAELRGEYSPQQSDDMLFGSAVHYWNQHGTLEGFPEYKSLFKKDNTMYAKYEGIQDCIDALANDPVCMAALKGRKEVIFTADMFGCKWKIMIDNYNPNWGVFSDLKVMKSLYDRFWNNEYKCWESFVEHYGYHIQMSIYAEVEKRATGRFDWLEPHIVVVTKETPPDKVVLKGFLQVIQNELMIVEENMPRILAVKAGKEEPKACGKCAYCRSKKQAKIIDFNELIA